MTLASFLKLVEIQTKVASMIPFFLGTFYALYRFESFNLTNFVLMLLSLLTFDMTTTALNNYMDYKRAVKTQGYGYESHNAIVSYKLKESAVVATIIFLLTIATTAGVFLFLNTGLVVLLLGAISFGIGILYSYGPVPISWTPLGEFFSGLIMGFIITFIAAYIHVIELNILDINIIGLVINININAMEIINIILVSLPAIVGIANIMLANNICDIDDDIVNKRYTLPIYIGKEAALKLFALLYYIGFAAIVTAIAVGAIPIVSVIALITFVPVSRNIKMFRQVQTKKDTFVLAVKNFVLMNTVLALSIGVGVIFRVLLGTYN